MVFAPRSHNIGNLVQGEHPKIRMEQELMGSLFSAENLQYL